MWPKESRQGADLGSAMATCTHLRKVFRSPLKVRGVDLL